MRYSTQFARRMTLWGVGVMLGVLSLIPTTALRAEPAQDEARLSPGQAVTVQFGNRPEADAVYRLDPEGRIALPAPEGLVFIRLAGLTPQQAAARIAERLDLKHTSAGVMVAPGAHPRPLPHSRSTSPKPRADALIPNPADPVEAEQKEYISVTRAESAEEIKGAAVTRQNTLWDYVRIDLYYGWCVWAEKTASLQKENRAARCEGDEAVLWPPYRYIPNSAESPGSPSRLEPR